jgi:hypothetical protein
MQRILDRILVSIACLVAVSAGALAQTGQEGGDDPHGGIICGTGLFGRIDNAEALANTARRNPELYNRMLDQAKHGRERLSKLSAVDDYPFFVLNRTTHDYYTVVGRLLYDGPMVKIWVDTADLKRVKSATITTLANALEKATPSTSRDPAKGILQNDVEVFGETPKTYEIDGQTWFLMTDIKDSLTGGFVGGYFSPWDQTQNAGSNQLNMLYIDSHEGIGNQSANALTGLLSTMAHEFQHLIHHNTNPQSETFFNEGCSETASIINGYRDRSNEGFLGATNTPIMRWSYNDNVGRDILSDYARAMTFIYYCREQYGEEFLHALTATRSTGMHRIDDALAAAGKSTNWQETLKGFAVANYVGKNFTDPHYSYAKPIAANPSLGPTVPPPVTKYTDVASASGSAPLQPYGSAYVMFDKPGGAVKIRFNADFPSYAAMAILYRGTSVESVREIHDNEEVLLGETKAYDRIVFALADLQPADQADAILAVRWSAERLASGVPSDAAGGALALTRLAADPGAGIAAIDFTTARPGSVSLALYDLRGELVRWIARGERFEPGAHSLSVDIAGLPSGEYFARLADGDAVVSGRMIVLR